MLIASAFRVSEILRNRTGALWLENRVKPSADFQFPYPKALQIDVGLRPALEKCGVKLPEETRLVGIDMIKYQTRLLVICADYWILCTKAA